MIMKAWVALHIHVINENDSASTFLCLVKIAQTACRPAELLSRVLEQGPLWKRKAKTSYWKPCMFPFGSQSRLGEDRCLTPKDPPRDWPTLDRSCAAQYSTSVHAVQSFLNIVDVNCKLMHSEHVPVERYGHVQFDAQLSTCLEMHCNYSLSQWVIQQAVAPRPLPIAFRRGIQSGFGGCSALLMSTEGADGNQKPPNSFRC